MIIPLYSDPSTNSSSWNQLESLARQYTNLNLTVIVNPDNGPGSAFDVGFQKAIVALKALNITVLGYVYTSYGSRAASDVIADMNLYKEWYGVNGIFLDEMSENPATASYYSNLTSSAHSEGLNPVIGNPGASVSTSLIKSVDKLVIYESSGIPPSSTICSETAELPREQFSLIAYGVDGLPSVSYLNSISSCVGSVYFTDAGNYQNTYNSLPGYFASEVSEIASVPAF
jgi:hypothetical protein